jgi:hypothetical protein
LGVAFFRTGGGLAVAKPVVLNFRERRRPDLLLQFPEGDYLVSGNLLVDDLGDLLQVEQAILKLGDGDESTFHEAMRDIQDAVMHLIRRTNPEAPDVSMTVPEIIELIAHITGAGSATEEVLNTILSLSGAKTVNGDGDGASAVEDVAETVERGGDATPLASTKPSRKSSSSSAKRTSGGRTGGATARGGSSRGTAKQPAGA